MITVKKYSASWCFPCKQLDKNLEGKKYEIVDVEDNIEESALFGIRNLPTVIFFKDGEIVERKVGIFSAQEFDEIIEKWQ